MASQAEKPGGSGKKAKDAGSGVQGLGDAGKVEQKADKTVKQFKKKDTPANDPHDAKRKTRSSRTPSPKKATVDEADLDWADLEEDFLLEGSFGEMLLQYAKRKGKENALQIFEQLLENLSEDDFNLKVAFYKFVELGGVKRWKFVSETKEIYLKIATRLIEKLV